MPTLELFWTAWDQSCAGPYWPYRWFWYWGPGVSSQLEPYVRVCERYKWCMPFLQPNLSLLRSWHLKRIQSAFKPMQARGWVVSSDWWGALSYESVGSEDHCGWSDLLWECWFGGIPQRSLCYWWEVLVQTGGLYQFSSGCSSASDMLAVGLLFRSGSSSQQRMRWSIVPLSGPVVVKNGRRSQNMVGRPRSGGLWD